MPKFSFPKLPFSKFKFPKFTFPKFALPKFALPKFKLPTLKLPKLFNRDKGKAVDVKLVKKIKKEILKYKTSSAIPKVFTEYLPRISLQMSARIICPFNLFSAIGAIIILKHETVLS